MEEQLSGVVTHIVYHNAENGYTVLTLAGDNEETTCVGYLADAQEGISLELKGGYTEHAAYGRQFSFREYTYVAPDSAASIELYLGSGAVKGIGKTLAGRIVKKFGADSLRILSEEPERLAEVKGISLKKAREIGTYAAEQAGMRHAMVFLAEYGISLRLSLKIYREYGEDLYEILRTNPYRLAADIDGVGFLTADKIAAGAGVARDSEYRIRSGILYVLTGILGEGSIYLPEPELLRKARELLLVEEEQIRHELDYLAMDGSVVIRTRDGVRIVYAGTYYHLELRTARMLLDLNMPTGISAEEAEEMFTRNGNESGILLEEEQRLAAVTAVTNSLLILTGGPGTGKTTTVNELIRFFRKMKKTVLLAAPTGRAAKRMQETTGYEASTIHRLLEMSSPAEDTPEAVRFERNASNPLEADVIIIDEMSMVDIFLMHSLLSAVSCGTRLILIGDVDQLPSVGPGSVLRDIIASGAFPCVRLTRIFRQAESSDIVMNAHRINRGEQIRLDNRSRDFFFLERSDPNVIISGIIELVRDKLPGYVHADPYEIQVLAPMKKGALGVERLNTILQRYLNPPSPDKAEKEHGERLFRVGDKVMQTRNNYQIEWEIRGRYGIASDSGNGIFNGDMGIVRGIDEFASVLEIEFDEGRMVDYPFSELQDLEHAYAVTIHKSQGSEYPAVVLPILGGPSLLMTRNLLYTAVTRAKSCVIILGSGRMIAGMIANETEQSRYTSLDERICELCGDGGAV